jgi:hypothetical protein
MAGTVTYTRKPEKKNCDKFAIEKITINWTSDASGNADASIPSLFGFIVKMITKPDGTAAPTADYDITLVGGLGEDALEGAGADRHTSDVECLTPGTSGAATPAFVSGDYTFTVKNAGNAKAGQCVLYVKESI